MRNGFIRSKAAMALLLSIAIWMVAAPISGARADYDQSKRWFEAQSQWNRNALQSALFWSGEYFGPIDARFGSLTYAALIAFQRRTGVAPTGVLDAPDRAALHEEAERIQQLVYYHARRSVSPTKPTYRSTGYGLASRILILP